MKILLIILAFFSINTFAQNNTLNFENQIISASQNIQNFKNDSFYGIFDKKEDNEKIILITVAGLNFGEIGFAPFEFKNFKKLLNIFFPKKLINNNKFEESFYEEYFKYLPLNEEEKNKIPKISRLPDTYLEDKIKTLPSYNEDIIIVPFAWSREPSDTDKTIPIFIEKLNEIYKEYGNKNKIYIIAHSWGSVLMHETLHRLYDINPNVKIDKLLTIGSPLIPGNFIVKIFLELEIKKEDLLKQVTHPKNVLHWKNVWAERDIYSNEIPACDLNIQIDKNIERFEPTLLDIILHNKKLRPIAKNDLLRFRDIKAWHSAYIFDYQAYLESIDKEIRLEVFNPIIAPQLLEYDKVKN